MPGPRLSSQPAMFPDSGGPQDPTAGFLSCSASAAILSGEDVIQPRSLRIHRWPIKPPTDQEVPFESLPPRWRTLSEVEAEHITRTQEVVDRYHAAEERQARAAGYLCEPP